MVEEKDLLIRIDVILHTNYNGLQFTERVNFDNGIDLPFSTYEEAIMEGRRRLVRNIEKYNFIKGEGILEDIDDLFEKMYQRNPYDPLSQDHLVSKITDMKRKRDQFTKKRTSW